MDQGENERSDDLLLERLRATAAVEVVPPDVIAAAKASYTWRSIDAELAELAYDSLDDTGTLVGVRGEGGPRALTFEAGEATIEVEVAAAGTSRRLEGQVVPAAAEQRLHRLDSSDPVVVAVDALGRFRADVRPGRLRLLCRFRPQSGAGTLLTEWVVV